MHFKNGSQHKFLTMQNLFFDLYNNLQETTNLNPRIAYMKPDPTALKNALKKREVELQKIILQMKQDNLHSSKVYKNLEQELENVKTKIVGREQD
jgi:hypothetical protein